MRTRFCFWQIASGFILAALCIASTAAAKDIYHIRALTEPQVRQMYFQMLEDASHYADRDWKTASFDSSAGYWGDGVSAGNEGIRTVADMLVADATVLRYDRNLSAENKRDLLTKSLAALRYAILTHRTGTQKCTDGKPWGATPQFGGESWQSGMWTGNLAWAAYLLWDQLDPKTQQGIHRVIAWEDDILAHRPPPNGLRLDTKAEENAWETPPLVLGPLMFPTDSHAGAWHEASIKYILNTLCTAADQHDQSVIDGKPLTQWVTGANLQPDFTLENHNIFHPAYVGCSCYMIAQNALYYTFAHKHVPPEVNHHLDDMWRTFKTFLLPWGESAYPQSMDWELHNLPYINLFASMATRGLDPFAARLEQSSLQYQRQWQIMCDGSLTLPGSKFGIARHAINAEQNAYALLAHELFGSAVKPLSAEAANQSEAGVHDYRYEEIIAQRTLNKFASFSWRNHVMGLVMPIEAWHEGNPDFIVPIANGLIGTLDLAPRRKVLTEIGAHSWKKSADGFDTSGTYLIDSGKIKQSLRMMSLGSRTVVYEDRVVAQGDVTMRLERGVPIGIENDEITGGERTLTDAGGQSVFDWKKPQAIKKIAGNWGNVDGRLGMVSLAGSGMAYVQANRYSGGMSVYTDVLYGSYGARRKHYKAGEQIVRRVVVLYVEVSTAETAKLAKKCEIRNGNVLHVAEPGGKAADIALMD